MTRVFSARVVFEPASRKRVATLQGASLQHGGKYEYRCFGPRWGAAIGAGAGIALHHIAVGVAIGVACGATIGLFASQTQAGRPGLREAPDAGRLFQFRLNR